MTIIGDWKAVDDTFLYQIRSGKYDHDDVMRLVEAFEDQKEFTSAAETVGLDEIYDLEDEVLELEGQRDEARDELEIAQRGIARLQEVLDEREGEIEELREELRGRMYRFPSRDAD